jgi:hypothetical protein
MSLIQSYSIKIIKAIYLANFLNHVLYQGIPKTCLIKISVPKRTSSRLLTWSVHPLH